MRWNPKKNRTEEKTQSLDVPNKLDIKNIYPKEAMSNTTDSKENLEEELRQIRDSRTTPLTKRWKPKQYKQERSKSAHVLQRAKLPDDSWLKEKSNTRLEEDRMNVREEIELIKKSRIKTLEIIDNLENERPSSRQEQENKSETLKELEEVRKARMNTENYNLLRKVKEHDFSEDPKSKAVESPNAKNVRFADSENNNKEAKEIVEEEEDTNLNSKMKAKLKHIQQQTEEEITKLKTKKFNPLKKIEDEQERSRSRSSEGGRDNLRSRSLSRLRNAGQRVKDLTNEKLQIFNKTIAAKRQPVE